MRRLRWLLVCAGAGALAALAPGAPSGRAAAAGSSGAAPAASLVAEVEPREPWVGQPVILRVRLILAEDLTEEPNYVPPVTTGFWAEAPSRPTSYVASEAGRRVLVTETRSRLYPLAPGIARIGAASADLALRSDATGWLRGRVPRRQATLRSQPIQVRVRPLPAGAPRGFAGAVGSFAVSWSADRARTAQDLPVTVWLDVRGAGNLPLMEAPVLAVPGAEVFSGTTDDSLALPGTLTPGRRRFQWNVLARQQGTLEIPPPLFAWFDPLAGRYLSAGPPTLSVEVGPPYFSSAGDQEAFPPVFLRDAPDPFHRGLAPWAWALAGLLAGAAVALWRRRAPVDPRADERARVAVWRNALRAAAGPAFWRAAEEVVAWLGVRGRELPEVRALVAAERYGGGEADADAVRLRLVKELAAALPPRAARWPARPVAVSLVALAVVALAFSGLAIGPTANALRLRAADQVARAGDRDRAEAAWEALWNEGARAPALAARLAWAEAARGALAPAAVWVLRGERVEARDPALRWASDLVREGGGLTGERPVRLPVRRSEWAVLALALGIAAGVLWARRRLAVALALLALLAGLEEPAGDWWAARSRQGVVVRAVTLEGTGLELDVGQVVRVLGVEGARARVRAGRDLNGHVPLDALLRVGGPS